ncbi:unnamed protein product [Hymenolepis diminuta]|uniref:Uncharacterized protein n=1 Tax=Hymenolepis diminuta TaxID=6216 RepID=A0A564Z2E0_HYMDI|nr:unnamed protein product [Hymenolepis diminuta]
MKVLSAKIETNISPDVYNTTTATLNYFKKSTQSLLVPVSLRELTTPTLVHVAGNVMKLHPSVRKNVEVTSLTHSMKSFMTEVEQARPFFEPTVPKQQSVPKILCVITRQVKYVI